MLSARARVAAAAGEPLLNARRGPGAPPGLPKSKPIVLIAEDGALAPPPVLGSPGCGGAPPPTHTHTPPHPTPPHPTHPLYTLHQAPPPTPRCASRPSCLSWRCATAISGHWTQRSTCPVRRRRRHPPAAAPAARRPSPAACRLRRRCWARGDRLRLPVRDPPLPPPADPSAIFIRRQALVVNLEGRGGLAAAATAAAAASLRRRRRCTLHLLPAARLAAAAGALFTPGAASLQD